MLIHNITECYFSLPIFEQNMGLSDIGTQCSPLTQNGSLILNPCGLIANSFFTGTIDCLTQHQQHLLDI